MTQFGLGTVQLGIPYGNKLDQPLLTAEESSKILEAAYNSNIRFFDTAHSYGLSEERIGAFLKRLPTSAQIAVSTKIPRAEEYIWKNKSLYKDFVFQKINESYSRLGLNKTQLIQFHQCEIDFLESKSMIAVVRDLLDSGLCEQIGISVYHPEQAECALALDEVSCLQIPFNLVDNRFFGGHLPHLYQKRSIRIISRSLFLQGVLHPSAILPPVKKKAKLLELRMKCINAANTLNVSLDQLAARFVFGNNQKNVHIALIGASTPIELTSLLRQEDIHTPLPSEWLAHFADITDFAQTECLIDPSTWQTPN